MPTWRRSVKFFMHHRYIVLFFGPMKNDEGPLKFQGMGPNGPWVFFFAYLKRWYQTHTSSTLHCSHPSSLFLYIHTHTYTPYTPLPVIASKRGQSVWILPTEDTWFLLHYYSTVDIMWLFTTQPRTSSYTPNRGHGLNSIFTSFPSSCSPHEPRTVHGGECVLGLLWNFRCVSSFGGFYTPLTSSPYTHPVTMYSVEDEQA